MLRRYQALFFSFIIHGSLLIAAFTLYKMERIPVKQQERCMVSLSQYHSQACITKPVVKEPVIQKEMKPIVKKTSTQPPKKVLPKAELLNTVKPKPIIKPVEKRELPEKQAAYVIPLLKPIVEKEPVPPVVKAEPIPEVKKNVIEPEVIVADVVPVEKKQLVTVSVAPEQPIAESTPYPVITPEQSYMDEHLALIVSLLQKNLYYPRIARRRGITGEVMISFELTTEGKVKNAAVISGKYAVLNRAAMTTLERLYGELPHPEEHLSLQVPIQYRLR